jgi:cyclomaltodextrinase
LADWAFDSVFYHIYPLGLLGTPAKNDFGAPPVERLERLIDWLDHIRGLGCNALYIGPLFESTAHGYDTADYWHLDRRLGTDETLKRFVAACHEKEIRVILDGVFNHVGRDFWAFRDVQTHGADSPYRGWFADLRFDRRSPFGDAFSYEAWNGNFDLVKLNLSSPAVREHLLGAVRSWIEDFGIDGLRLDAADVIDLDFLRTLAAHCRSLKPDFWIFGEIVHGDYREWANPETLDSVTNYEAYKGLYSSLVDRNYFEIAHTLNREFAADGRYVGLPLYNFVDNHDQDRVASKLKEGRLLYPLYLLLLTMPGVPSIYYGSEWRLLGKLQHHDDSQVRPAIELASGPGMGSEPALADAIRRLAQLRAELPALRRGSYRQLHVAAEQFAFERELDGQTVVVMLNAAEGSAEVAVPVAHNGEWRDALNGGSLAAVDGKLRAEVPAGWGCVFVAV